MVYSYDRSEQNEHCVVFFETKLEESYQKYVKQLLHITAFEDHCVIVNRADDQAGTVSFNSLEKFVSFLRYSLSAITSICSFLVLRDRSESTQKLKGNDTV